MKRKGFTLVELLAVIVILAIIALIATPIIIGIIEDAKEKAHMDSAYGILNGAQFYYKHALLDQSKRESIENVENILGNISYQGEKPQSGEVRVLEDGKIGLSVEYDGKCYYKGYGDRKITRINKENENCTIDKEPIIVGDLVTLKDNSKWYILADRGDKVRLLKETPVEDESFVPYTKDYDTCINGLFLNQGMEVPYYPLEYVSNYCNIKKVTYPYIEENLSDMSAVYKNMSEYMDTTYIPALMERFKNSGMDINSIRIELPNSKEIFKALGITGDGSHINPEVEKEMGGGSDFASMDVFEREKFSFFFTPIMNLYNSSTTKPPMDTLDDRYNFINNNIVRISEYNNNYFWLTNSIFYLSDNTLNMQDQPPEANIDTRFTFYPNYLTSAMASMQVNHPTIRPAVTVLKNEIIHIEEGLHRKVGLDEFAFVSDKELVTSNGSPAYYVSPVNISIKGMGATKDNLSKVKYCVTGGEEHSCIPTTFANIGQTVVSIAEGQKNLHFHICLQGIDKNNNEGDICCSSRIKVVEPS